MKQSELFPQTAACNNGETMDFLPESNILFLRADKEVPYGTVVQVMGEIKTAGIDRLGIVAEETRPENKG